MAAQTPDSALVAKVQKLLALAADQEGSPEGELAARIARRILEEHAIELESVGSPEEADPLERALVDLGSRSNWRRVLAWALAHHCACRFAYVPNSTQAWIWGHRSSIDVLRYLFVVVERQIQDEAEAFAATIRPSLRRAKLADFRYVTACAFANRLHAMKQEEAASPGTELVHCREQQVERFQQEDSLALGRGRQPKRQVHQDAYDAGQAAAERLSLREGLEQG